MRRLFARLSWKGGGGSVLVCVAVKALYYPLTKSSDDCIQANQTLPLL